MKEKLVIGKVHLRQTGSSVPVMMSFQNGRLDAVAKEHTQFCRMNRGQGTGKRQGAMLITGDQIYHGDIGSGETNGLTDTYICVRNKQTKKVRIIQIEQAALNNSIYRKLEGKQNALDMSEEYTRQRLLKEFGGRKAARFAANQEKMKLDIDAVQTELETTVQETSFNEDPKDSAEGELHYDSIRPNFNKDADKLQDVYNIDDVVSSELLERLEEESKTIHSTPIESIPISSEFLLNNIRSVQSANASPEGLLRIKIIIYMDCLLNLIKSRVRMIKDFEMSRITEKVENDVRKRFSDPNLKAFTRTAVTTEKALCHFIVLALLVCENYQVDLNVLAQELNMPRQKIIKYAHIVNARRKGQTDVLALCLPKKVPALPTKFKRRSKN